jgi:hypothetical protein
MIIIIMQTRTEQSIERNGTGCCGKAGQEEEQSDHSAAFVEMNPV